MFVLDQPDAGWVTIEEAVEVLASVRREGTGRV